MPRLVLASDPSLQALPTDPTTESRRQAGEPHLQAKVTPKPCWAGSCACPEPRAGSAGQGPVLTSLLTSTWMPVGPWRYSRWMCCGEML